MATLTREQRGLSRRTLRCAAGLGRELGATPKARERAEAVVSHLLDYDPLRLTKFEFSFKMLEGRAAPTLRFLNLDADAYSCRSDALFLTRLRAFETIMQGESLPAGWPRLQAALARVAQTPMDLYFGADISPAGTALFGFWLIFGGVKRDGKVKFCPYDLQGLITDTLSSAGLVRPKDYRPDVLNLGFDVSRNKIHYKLYYLCRELVIPGRDFSATMRSLKTALSDFRYFHFYSETYGADGVKVKEKLFVEFLEDIAGSGPRTRLLLEALGRTEGIALDAALWIKILEATKARISLISFEGDGTLTIYLRP